MKKIYFIIIGGLILSGLLGFWVYSFLYGSPDNDSSFFTDLGIFGQNNTEDITPLPEIVPEPPMVDIPREPLRQLSEKPVVGMRMLETGSSSIMRFIEAGTGHIYDIDMLTGQESRISQISVPNASEGDVSPSGDYVAIRSGYGNQNDVILINLTNTENPTSVVLPNQIESFAFGFNNELLFTEITAGQTEGKGYLPSTGITRRLFTAPFTAHNMAWSNSSTSNHVIYTKPAASMLGYAYEITATGLNRLPQSGYGLSINQSAGIKFVGRTQNDSYTTQIIDRKNNANISPAAIVPDKCVAGHIRKEVYFCASPIEFRVNNFPDMWYQGTFSFDDHLWVIGSGRSTLLVHPFREVGKSLDIVKIQLSPREDSLYFTNKTDKSLWVYEL